MNHYGQKCIYLSVHQVAHLNFKLEATMIYGLYGQPKLQAP